MVLLKTIKFHFSPLQRTCVGFLLVFEMLFGMTACGTPGKAKPVMILGINGPEFLKQTMETDPIVKDWVIRNGLPDYVHKLISQNNFELVYVKKDLVIDVIKEESKPTQIISSYGVPEDLSRWISKADSVLLIAARQKRLAKAANKNDNGSPVIQEHAKRMLKEAPCIAQETWKDYFQPASRGEFETTEDYRARVSEVDPDSLFFYDLPQESVEIKYDIDRRQMVISVLVNECSSLLKKLRGYRILLCSDTTSKGKIGSNAFGKEALYIDTRGNQYSVLIRNLDEFIAACGFKLGTNRILQQVIEISLPMDVDTARLVKDKIRIKIGVSFFSRNRSETYTLSKTATIDQPYEMVIYNHCMDAKLLALQIFDSTKLESLKTVVGY